MLKGFTDNSSNGLTVVVLLLLTSVLKSRYLFSLLLFHIITPILWFVPYHCNVKLYTRVLLNYWSLFCFILSYYAIAIMCVSIITFCLWSIFTVICDRNSICDCFGFQENDNERMALWDAIASAAAWYSTRSYCVWSRWVTVYWMLTEPYLWVAKCQCQGCSHYGPVCTRCAFIKLSLNVILVCNTQGRCSRNFLSSWYSRLSYPCGLGSIVE